MMDDLVDIERLSNDGRGIAHVDGKVIFVAGGLPGERVRVETKKRHKRYDEAIAVERLQSPYGDAVCWHFEDCGGCDWMRLGQEEAFRVKAGLVRETFERLLKEPLGERWREPFASAPLGYRCRITLKLREGRVGYFEAGTHRFVPIDTCLAAVPAIQTAVPRLSADATRFLSAGFDEIELRASPGDDLPLAVCRGKGRLPRLPAYLRGLAGDRASAGDTMLVYEAAGVRLRAGPHSFVQVNLPVNEKMITDVIEMTDDSAAVVDAFCGIGNFSIPLSAKGARVLGMEGARSAIEDAERNARDNGVEAAFLCLAETSMADGWLASGMPPDATLILDPPRAGAKALLGGLRAKGLRPKNILYVSCDPGTLARDAGALRKEGYSLESLRTYDMFPQTHHVESLARFSAA